MVKALQTVRNLTGAGKVIFELKLKLKVFFYFLAYGYLQVCFFLSNVTEKVHCFV